mmetsp:Transcript_59537/g.98140  ORF Transcript_59537/g.98140 Transcript_59537/m.98140 type:complete len:161 (-) Transcript_59537:56-538(-)
MGSGHEDPRPISDGASIAKMWRTVLAQRTNWVIFLFWQNPSIARMDNSWTQGHKPKIEHKETRNTAAAQTPHPPLCPDGKKVGTHRSGVGQVPHSSSPPSRNTATTSLSNNKTFLRTISGATDILQCPVCWIFGAVGLLPLSIANAPGLRMQIYDTVDMF